MKILTYKYGGETAVGVLKNDGSEVVPVNYLGCSAIDMCRMRKSWKSWIEIRS